MGCQRLTYHQKYTSKTESTPIFEMGGKQCSDYQVFGMQMPGRNHQTDAYRYGYQGSEMDDEIKGEGNSYTTHFRQLDPRVGRWLSIDPKANAQESPYVSMGNNPIVFNDPYGDTIRVDGTPGKNGNFEVYTMRGNSFYDGKGKEYVSGTDKFMDDVISAISDIKSSDEGSRLIGVLASHKKSVTIEYVKDKSRHMSGIVQIDFKKTTSLPTTNGSEVAPSWLVFAHELAHAEDYLNGTIDRSVWVSKGTDGLSGDVPNSEKYATHVENKIRAQSSLSLRTHYGQYSDGSGVKSTRIIDKNGNSLFFKYSVKLIFISTSENQDGVHGRTQTVSKPFNYSKHVNDNEEENVIID